MKKAAVNKVLLNASEQPSSPEQALPDQLSQPTDMKRYYRDLHHHTTLLTAAKRDVTVFLGSDPITRNHHHPAEPILEVLIEGQKQCIPLKGKSYMIGRSEEDAEFSLNEVGVSRLHTEFFKDEEGYGVRDVGSKNGTFLNGECLVPYQSYKLTTGDTIRILKTEFIYKIDS
ncbi:FHA domain-containing protein FhaA [compost metagenome]